MRTSILVEGRPLPTGAFSTLAPDPLLPTKGDRGAPRLTMGSSTSDLTSFSPRADPTSYPLSLRSPRLAGAPPNLTPHPHLPPERLPPLAGTPAWSGSPHSALPAPAVPAWVPSLPGGSETSRAVLLFLRHRHTLPPLPPPPELPLASREPGHRGTGSSLARGTEPGSGRRALTREGRPCWVPGATPRHSARRHPKNADRAWRHEAPWLPPPGRPRRKGVVPRRSRKLPRPAPGPPSGGSCVSTTSFHAPAQDHGRHP